ncbi:MAG: alcohol dehydrogenase [Spirochaetes bacterium]|nr:MAG: alcohol dehydrogenase [Spirochaetota bacterium]
MKALVFDLSIPKLAALKLLPLAGKRMYYRGPLSMLRLADIPEPGLPSADWVKIRTKLCGFCGSDLNLILIKDSLMASPFTSFPCVLGHELCGEVVEAGKNVKGIRAGDLVTVAPMLGCAVRGITPECPACKKGRPGNCENFAHGAMAPGMFMGLCRDAGGGFAEYLVAHKSQLFRVPDGVSPVSAALTEPLAVALQAVLDNRPRDGEKALVIGGGVIGAMIVKAIRGLGVRCEIAVVEPSPFAADYAMKSGADHHGAGPIHDVAVKVAGARSYSPMMGQAILQGGFERVYDTVGHSATLQASLIAAAACGTVSLVGIGKHVGFDPTPLWLKLQTIKGVFAYGYHDDGRRTRHVFEMALDMMQKRKVRVDDMLTHTFPIHEYKSMIDVNLNKGKHRAIKTALRF